MINLKEIPQHIIKLAEDFAIQYHYPDSIAKGIINKETGEYIEEAESTIRIFIEGFMTSENFKKNQQTITFRHLSLFDKDENVYNYVTTPWTDEELSFKWDVISQHTTESEMTITTRELNTKRFNKIYDILVELGAPESQREEFIQAHCKNNSLCDEWRFQGKLGFGGKYRRRRNSVDCYKEDETIELKAIIDKANVKLREIKP